MVEQACNVNQNSAIVESLALVWQNGLIVFFVGSLQVSIAVSG